MDEKLVTWHQSLIGKDDRRKLHGHGSVMIWFTGLSGSGKSTIANALQQKLFEKGINVYLLDGDNLRHGINQNLSFSQEDRKENVRRVAEIGKLFVDAGVVVLSALISPFEVDRADARALFDEMEFIEVYIKCSIKTCEKRDPKGLYKKAHEGKIKQFTGVDQSYETPRVPEITIDTDNMSIEESVEILLTYLIDNEII
ncbi:adenylyl-sulfate kinase [Radiobacillus sp. PE A8.2]|uniref:adenylyl-sulfate kinase n=1 Tax=Radiobacillus sp. PE A8.2 TaxID=3380349 RepID=UPI00388EAE29